MNEPQLGADFATRVLEAADRVAARARRRRWLTGTTVLCVGIVATAVWLERAAAPRAPLPTDRVFASASLPQTDETGAGGSTEAAAPDALAYLFPDAGPLARYAVQDGSDESATGAGALFADDE